MTDRKSQKQSAASGAAALQAGRDIIVSGAMTPEQMAKIMVALSGQLSEYLAEAKTQQEKRFEELRTSIVEEFSREDTRAQREAFKDPDFQYVLKAAHDSYARSGEAQLKRELVRLIGERSSKATGSRVARILNEAVDVAGKLTREEYASLGVLFVFLRVNYHSGEGRAVIDTHNRLLSPFIDDLPDNGQAIEYLDSLGCITLNRIMSNELDKILEHKFGYLLGPGFDIQELGTLAGGIENLQRLAGMIFTNGQEKFWFKFSNENEFKEALSTKSFPEEDQSRMLEFYKSGMLPIGEIRSRLETELDGFPKILKFLETRTARQASISLLGCALAHSALVEAIGLEAPLEIWIK